MMFAGGTLLLCAECMKPADGRVHFDDVAGSIEHPGQCRDHLLASRSDMESRYRTARVTIAWASCPRCGGEGDNEGRGCGECLDLTDAGGPFRYGDILHHDEEAALYLAPGHARDSAAVWPLFETAFTNPGDRWEVNVNVWTRCGVTPCHHAQGATP